MLDTASEIIDPTHSKGNHSASNLFPVTQWILADQQPDYILLTSRAASRKFNTSVKHISNTIHLTPAATVFFRRHELLRVMQTIIKSFAQHSINLTFSECVRTDEVEYKTRGGRLNEDRNQPRTGAQSRDSNDATKLINAEWLYGTFTLNGRRTN